MVDLNGNPRRRLVCLVGLMLAFGTFACYGPACRFGYVNLDDSLYVYQTPMVMRGLSWPGVVWAFQCVLGGNWNPVVWLSHMADCQLYGLAPAGHHVTNLLLHVANVLLLFLILHRTTGAVWRSGLAAALFAWHPLHVESVVWISERKDVLSGFFFMLTLWAYCRYAEKSVISDHRLLSYVLSLCFFALGLMSKPMLVTVPFVLLLLDYWPLGRRSAPGAAQGRYRPAGWGRLGLEKAPFVALSLAASVLAVWSQRQVEALGTEPLFLRLENAAVSYVTYVGKLFWPLKLAVFYPYPDAIPLWSAAGAALLLAGVTWLALREVKRRPYLAVGWLWFLGTMVPMIGLVQVGMQAMADRYTYLPCIGLGLAASWGLADLAAAWPRRRAALAGAAALALGGCLATTWRQIQCWRDSTALYEHALQVTVGNHMAHENLGNLLMDAGKLDAAVKHFQAAIRLTPTLARPYNQLGKAYVFQAKLDDAMIMFSNAARLNPGLAQARWNLGTAYLAKGKTAEALDELKAAVQISPEDIEAHRRLADTLIKLGRAAEALPYAEVVVRALPQDAHAYYVLGSACLAAKRRQEAVVNFSAAVRLAPNTPECLDALAWIYATSPEAALRNGPEAVRLAEAACKLTQRQQADLLDTLAAAYAEVGRFADAMKAAEELRALAAAAHDTNAVDMARQRLELYKAGKPYRDE